MTARTAQTLALATLLFVSAVPAFAQYGRPINEQEKQGLWRVGSFRLTPLVQLRNAGVDTNPFLTSAVESEETEVVLRGGLQAYVPVGRRFRLRADGWLDYTFYSNALEPRALFPGGDVRAEVDVSRFTLFAGGGHFRARQRYTTDIDTRIERTEDWINGGVQYQITSIVGIDFGAEDRRYRYLPDEDDPDGDRIKVLLDRDSLSYQGRFRYAITPLTTLLVTAEVIEDTFLFSEPSRATTRSYRYLGGFEFGQTTRRVLWPLRRVLLQWEQDHHHLGRRDAGLGGGGVDPACAVPGAAGAGSGAALRALRPREQLPDEQPAGRGGPRSAAGAPGSGGAEAADLLALPGGAWLRGGYLVHARGAVGRVHAVADRDPGGPGRVRRDAGGHPSPPRVARHRGPSRLEADAPSTGLP